jgi:hypothetical protein
MQESDDRPERLDLADLYIRAMRAARDASVRLDAADLSHHELVAIQQVLRSRVLPALADETLLLRLAEIERRQDQTARRPSAISDRPSKLLAAVVGELLDDADRQSPDAKSRSGLWTPQDNTVARSVHLHLQVFIDTARPFADQPVPSADHPGRHAWIQGIKAVLDKAADMLVNLAVAAAFTVTAVQSAAQHAVTETVEVAGRVLDHATQEWPSLVAVGAVAVQAAAGVSVVKQAWESVRSVRAEPPGARGRAAVSSPEDDLPRMDERLDSSREPQPSGESLATTMEGPGPSESTNFVGWTRWIKDGAPRTELGNGTEEGESGSAGAPPAGRRS